MPKKLKLSPQQRDILWLLEEAGSETLQTVILALKSTDLSALAASLQGLVDLGLIDFAPHTQEPLPGRVALP